ncbi:MAG: hypothetical protein JXB49_06785 [Bacteroidales bacterium]|nr:hypothetical protein [Bacteroidales bacterium]
MKIGKYSFGIGDRFAQQGVAQLSALKKAKDAGIQFTPVWNKSFREHSIIGTSPVDTRKEADAAVKQLGWTDQYLVDADHINLKTVDAFVDHSDFFTLDVADYIGTKADDASISAFIANNKKYMGKLSIPGISHTFDISESLLTEIAGKFLFAIQEAGKIYRHIESKKGANNFITEVSMDEVNQAQTPVEMFFILSAVAAEKIPAQTIAPKFTGRFNKGVDYVGDLDQFAKEFEEDLLVIDFAIKEFGLPENLKLSVHSGSDKFSIYPIMGNLIKKYNKGIHVKTAGTTWLEEMIGLAMAGGDALAMAKKIYTKALEKTEALCAPYATVIDIDTAKLPTAVEVESWSGEKLANSLRHIPGQADYNPNFRQLIHVGYKVAADLGDAYINMLNANAKIVGEQVSQNIFDRHIKRLFNI